MNKGLLEYRAVFILLIFLYHAGVFPIGGTFGVSAFFILSGFCTVLGYNERVNQTGFYYKLYLIKRLIKYYPLHWLLLLIVLVPDLFSGFSINNNGLQLAANFFLVQSLIPIKEFFFSFNAVSWYLSDTVFFVALAPAILLLFNKTKLGGAFLLLALSLLFTLLFCLLPENYIHSIVYINPVVRIADFVFGVWLAYSYKTIEKMRIVSWVKEWCNKFPTLYPLIVLSILYVSVLLYNRIWELAFFGIIYWLPCAVILILCSICSLKKIRLVQSFGSISFEFFMVHQLCMNALTKMQNAGLFTINSQSIRVFLYFATAAVLAYLLHRFFTKPVTAILQSLIK